VITYSIRAYFRASRTHEQAGAIADVQLAIANNPVLADIFLRGLRDLASLNGAELPQFSALSSTMCRLWEDHFFQWAEGNLDLRVWRGIEASINDVCSMPGLQAWWKTRSHWYAEQFQTLIEEKIASGRGPAMYRESTA